MDIKMVRYNVDGYELKTVDINRLSSLCQNKKTVVKIPCTGCFVGLHCVYGFGELGRDNKVTYSLRDRRKLRDKLKELVGIDFSVSLDDLKSTSRIDAANVTGNEKLFNSKVHRESVLLKAVSCGSAELLINGSRTCLPAGGELKMDISDITQLGHSQILVVENYEAFKYIHCLVELFDLTVFEKSSLLVVYRCDTVIL